MCYMFKGTSQLLLYIIINKKWNQFLKIETMSILEREKPLLIHCKHLTVILQHKFKNNSRQYQLQLAL